MGGRAICIVSYIRVGKRTEEMPEFAAVHRYALLEFVPHTFDQPDRAAFARAMTDYCGAAIKAMPTNTPAENAWLRNEVNTADMDKIRHLTSTSEYARFRLASLYNDCVDRGKKLLAAQSAGDRRAEADMFVSLAATFNYDRDLVIYARNAAMNEDRFGVTWIASVRNSFLVAAMRAIESIPR